MRPLLLAVVLALAGSGCVSVDVGEGGGKAHVQYRLEDLGKPSARADRPVERALLVVSLPSPSVGDTFSIAYSRSPQQRSLYQYASWADRPSNRIAQLLTQRIDERGLFASVAELGHGVGGDLLLNVTVDELVHDVAANRVDIRMTAELVDRDKRSLLARRRFDATAAVEQNNAASAAAAMSRALTTVLDEIVGWLGQAAQRLAPRAAQ